MEGCGSKGVTRNQRGRGTRGVVKGTGWGGGEWGGDGGVRPPLIHLRHSLKIFSKCGENWEVLSPSRDALYGRVHLYSPILFPVSIFFVLFSFLSLFRLHNIYSITYHHLFHFSCFTYTNLKKFAGIFADFRT